VSRDLDEKTEETEKLTEKSPEEEPANA